MDNRNKFVKFFEERCFEIFLILGILDVTLIGLTIINAYDDIVLIPIVAPLILGLLSIIYFIVKAFKEDSSKYLNKVLMVISGFIFGIVIGLFINVIACGFIW